MFLIDLYKSCIHEVDCVRRYWNEDIGKLYFNRQHPVTEQSPSQTDCGPQSPFQLRNCIVATCHPVTTLHRYNVMKLSTVSLHICLRNRIPTCAITMYLLIIIIRCSNVNTTAKLCKFIFHCLIMDTMPVFHWLITSLSASGHCYATASSAIAISTTLLQLFSVL